MDKRTLHIINCPPSRTEIFTPCLNAVSENDAILLLEDAVYAADSRKPLIPKNIMCYAISPDLKARSIHPHEGIQSISYDEFVDLCSQYQRTVSWY